MACDCYHCGLPVPQDTDHTVLIDGVTQRMCCIGCQAVAQSIVDNGLADYYRHRDAMPESQREAMPQELQELGLFDHPDFQKSFVRPIGDHEREASLILEGITCAACVWLNERHVASQPGVSAVDINYATHRARVRWDDSKIKLSDILGAIRAIGYRAYPYDAQRSEQVALRERRSMLWRVFVAGFSMMQVMMYAIPVYLAGEDGMTHDLETLMRWASLLLTIPVVAYSAQPFFAHAWRDVRMRRLGMDVPVALGVGGAFIASVWATLTNGPEVYFDSVAMFVFFLLGGRYLEMLARQKALRGVEELGKILPAFAEQLDGWPSTVTQRVPVTQLEVGHFVRVRPGEVIPADGMVIDGQSEVNEALLTGESQPVAKSAGSHLTGGCINMSSPLVFRVEQVGEKTRLAAICQLMERAAMDKPHMATYADRVAAIFIITLLALAALTWGVWYFFIDSSRALWICVSVLVVACPCALSLATPTALTIATDVLARMGILVTRGHAVETLANANHFVFDKTGTLSYGAMTLEEVECLNEADEEALCKLGAALEQGAEHPVAIALCEAVGDELLPYLTEIVVYTGQGVSGKKGHQAVWIGRPDFVAEQMKSSLPPELHDFGARSGTVIALGQEGKGWLGLFRFADRLRVETPTLIAKLDAEHIPMTVLSGDAPSVVSGVAAELGIKDAHGGMTPQDKQRFIASLQQRPDTIVVMVGDGVNDAPVLAQAHVSVAMGGGTDLARNQADIVLLNENLAELGRGIDLARKTLRIIRQNLWWSFIYNFMAVPLAMMGWVTPWMAGIGMACSSLFVVLNAMRLQRAVPYRN